MFAILFSLSLVIKAPLPFRLGLEDIPKKVNTVFQQSVQHYMVTKNAMVEIGGKSYLTPSGHVLLLAPLEASTQNCTPIQFLEDNVEILPDHPRLVDAVPVITSSKECFQCFVTSSPNCYLMAARIEGTHVWIAISNHVIDYNPCVININRQEFQDIQHGFMELLTGRNVTSGVVPTRRFE